MRRRVDAQAPPLQVSRWERLYHGRPAVELKGRPGAAGDSGPVHEYAIYDPETGRVVTYVYFPHASTRRAGEPIISLSEISTRADVLARTLLPGDALTLVSIQRYRASGQESFYYEARYAPPQLEIPFFDPPVRLLLDASTGRLFRLDMDSDWLQPGAGPRARISRQAAGRIAALLLRQRDLSGAFGEGARFGKIGEPELFLVRPNAWLGFHAEDPAARVRVAWVVPFTLAGEAAGRQHSLFVDASGGHALGGIAGQDDAPLAR